MKLYAALATFSAVYFIALTLEKTQDVQFLTLNAVIGATMPLALVVSILPAVGPFLYETVIRTLTSVLDPPLQLDVYLDVLKIVSWTINILFTASLIMYVVQYRRYLARKIIKALLF